MILYNMITWGYESVEKASEINVSGASTPIFHYSSTRPVKGFIVVAPCTIITGATEYTGSSEAAL